MAEKPQEGFPLILPCNRHLAAMGSLTGQAHRYIDNHMGRLCGKISHPMRGFQMFGSQANGLMRKML